MCYVLKPDQMLLKPFQDVFLISIIRNITSENMDMRKIFLQTSSNDTYYTLTHKMTGLKNKVLEVDFVENGTYMAIEYTESNIEFIKDCSEVSYFKCWTEKLIKTKAFNCANKCFPIIYESLMDFMDRGRNLHHYFNHQVCLSFHASMHSPHFIVSSHL